MNGSRILLIVAGGIAAYKSLELIRRLRDRGAQVRCVLTPAATHFVTPLSVAALSGHPVHEALFDPQTEAAMGHIRLSRESDLIVVAPATADLLARMATGQANDLASAVLLAATAPILIAPSMNPQMWAHPATQANLATLESRGVIRVGPGTGDTACGEEGQGRMAEVPVLIEAIATALAANEARAGSQGDPEQAAPLCGRHALVTSGPTHEPIDPVRYIANHSSGRQGHAIAAALARLGARVTLVSGPVTLADPEGVSVVRVTTAREMLAACQAALPADIAVCAAAVADWSVAAPASQKLKKAEGPTPVPAPVLTLEPNPDILATLAAPGPRRPSLVVGFAAETEAVVDHATVKRRRKGCDWIVANDVSAQGNGGRGDTFGGRQNTVHLITSSGCEDWPTMDKEAVAARLATRIARILADPFVRKVGP
ncbi:phosphopantothenate synthase [Pararhodospirillum oryzae]|uniref:Coenzyme A biosynthesis bifunctional protein CoaBC n=1 Tax=Pararhodospirillum oryzae TaxID=478448 RepID=A0A512H5Y4_9PROT|nr:phosphopantothenate synthase [Pararhodospirillum oryzae]